MFDFQPKQSPVLEAVTFNFDTSDFTSLVTESDRSISSSINSYRTLMTETLNESAGVLTEDSTLIMEQANEHIGQKIMKVLVAIKNWLVKTVSSIILKIQTLVTSNKKVIDKIKPAVEAKMKDGTLANLKAELYDYNLGAIKVEDVVEQWKLAHQLLGNISSLPQAAMDEAVKKIEESSKGESAVEFASALGIDVKASKDIAIEARKILRKGGERKTTQFSMAFFDVVENFDKIKEPIQKTFKELTAQVDTMIADVKKNVKDTPATTPEEKAHKSSVVAYFNAYRRSLGVALNTAVLLNSLKLQAAVEQMREAKQFCVHAANYKAVKEDASEPYAPYLDFSGDDSGYNDDDEDSLNLQESTAW
jgi:hypothetical protein